MKFRALSPIDCQCKEDGESNHVKELNDQIRLDMNRMQIGYSKACHGDRCGNAQYGNRNAEDGAEPTYPSMQSHVAHYNKSRLENKKDHPPRENERMDIEY